MAVYGERMTWGRVTFGEDLFAVVQSQHGATGQGALWGGQGCSPCRGDGGLG